MLNANFYPDKASFLEYFKGKKQNLINKKTKVSSMGSCFATNIGRFLLENDYNYLVKESLKMSVSETALNPYIAASARWDFVYNTTVARQIFMYSFTDDWKPKTRWWFRDKKAIDPYRRGAEYKKGTQDKEFDLHRLASKSALEESDVFILTLGLTELWRDKRDKSTYFRTPLKEIFDPDVHEFYVQSMSDIIRDLEYIYNTLKIFNNGVQFVLTVSPVPFNATFRTDVDAVSANMVSKSKLRVAVDIFKSLHPEIIYFPSYELILMSEEYPFVDDGRHIKPDVVLRMMKIFEENFCY